MSLNILKTITTNCNCNDSNLLKVYNNIQDTLIDKGNKLYLYQLYETGKELSKLDIFLTVYQKDMIDTRMRRLCKLSSSILNTEETYIEKYCHEDEVI